MTRYSKSHECSGVQIEHVPVTTHESTRAGEAAGKAAGEAAAGDESAVAALVSRLDLVAAAERLVAHHQAVLGIQGAMYRRAAAPPVPGAATPAADAQPLRSEKHAMATLMGEMDALDACMASLDAWGRGVDAPPVAPPTPIIGEAGAMKSSGFGGGAKGGKAAPKKKGAKKRK